MRTADPSSMSVAEHASMRTGQRDIRLIGWHVRRSARGSIRHAGMRAGLPDCGKIVEHADRSDMLARVCTGTYNLLITYQ
jgi:hypothetical protein